MKRLSAAEAELEGMKARLYDLQASGLDAEMIYGLHRNATLALKDAMRSAQADDAGALAAGLGEVESIAGELKGNLESARVLMLLSEYRWQIAIWSAEAVFLSYIVSQVLLPFFRLSREIARLGAKEKELVETRIGTEKQYFRRQIDEATFNSILVKKQEEILHARTLASAKKAELQSLLSARLSPAALLSWLLGGPRRLGAAAAGRLRRPKKGASQ